MHQKSCKGREEEGPAAAIDAGSIDLEPGNGGMSRTYYIHVVNNLVLTSRSQTTWRRLRFLRSPRSLRILTWKPFKD